MHDVALTVFAVTGMLGMVSLLLPLADRLAVPYAVILAATGCAIGGVVFVFSGGVGMTVVNDVLRTLGGFDLTAEGFLFIFLPALLFEASINVNVRRLVEEIAPILLLAVVAVIVSTGVVGIALWGASGEPIVACLLLASILATTDPVAVIAIFRDIGAPRRLTMLVEGESLLNDAAAISIFTLLIAMLTGERTASALTVTLEFLKDFAGGLAVGYIAGRAACFLLPALRDLRLGELTLTVALPYVVFVVGEHYLDVSGVVAVVGAGLVMSYEGRRRLSPSSWESLVRSWEVIGYWASALIFLLATMTAPATLINASWRDIVFLLVVILSAIAARGVTLFGLLPLLSAARISARVNNDYKLVILWGGMRGAVSLALALAAMQNPLISHELRQFIGVLASGFVLFTLFVMAPTLRPLMRWLELDVLSPAELALRDRVVALSLSSIDGDLRKIAADHNIEPAVAGEAAERYRRHIHAAAEIAEENAQIAPAPRLRGAIAIALDREHEFYLEYFEARTMSRRAVALLLTHVGWLRDAVRNGSIPEYRIGIARSLAFSRGFRMALWCHRQLRLEGPLARELADRFEVLLAQRLVVREIVRFNERQLKQLFGAGIAETIEAELKRRLETIDQGVAALMLQYPSYARALQIQFLTLSAIRLEDQRYRQLFADAIITQEMFNDLQRELAMRRRAAEARPPLDLGLERDALVARVPLFRDLPPDRLVGISRLLRPRFVPPGEVVVRKGERGDLMYFISSGAVEVKLGEASSVRLGTGDFFGEIALLTRQPRSADVAAISYCQLLSLSRRELRTFLKSDRALRERIYEVARERQRAQAA